MKIFYISIVFIVAIVLCYASERAPAKANGEAESFEKSKKLFDKYRPNSVSILLPKHGNSTTVVDKRAWNADFSRVDGRISAKLFLDKLRYKDVTPQRLAIQLRYKGRTPEEESALECGQDFGPTFRVDLPFRLEADGIYTVSIDLPQGETRQYVLQIAAEIEEGYKTGSVIDIPGVTAIRSSLLGGFYEVDKVEVPPKALSQRKPTAPAGAKEASGSVVLKYIIEEDGTVLHADIELVINVKNDPKSALNQAALDGVKQWRFEPATIGGKPVRCRKTARVDFGNVLFIDDGTKLK
ncbi:MAG: energy transducer TonB [Opitutae bacterium]|nr:energy transducer TonB [Opitutae bacterium]